jgi:putative flippase GtrA
MTVSVVTTVISVSTLAIATVGFGIVAWAANILATSVATVPSYHLNRRWTWGKQGASHPWREVLPFWMLAFAGLVLSTIFVALTDPTVTRLHSSLAVHTGAVIGAHLAGFGVLWIVQFVLLDRVLFRVA